jgi:hypothetical protein
VYESAETLPGRTLVHGSPHHPTRACGPCASLRRRDMARRQRLVSTLTATNVRQTVMGALSTVRFVHRPLQRASLPMTCGGCPSAAEGSRNASHRQAACCVLDSLGRETSLGVRCVLRVLRVLRVLCVLCVPGLRVDRRRCCDAWHSRRTGLSVLVFRFSLSCTRALRAGTLPPVQSGPPVFTGRAEPAVRACRA